MFSLARASAPFVLVLTLSLSSLSIVLAAVLSDTSNEVVALVAREMARMNRYQSLAGCVNDYHFDEFSAYFWCETDDARVFLSGIGARVTTIIVRLRGTGIDQRAGRGIIGFPISHALYRSVVSYRFPTGAQVVLLCEDT